METAAQPEPSRQNDSGVMLAVRVGSNHLLFIPEDILAEFHGMNCFEVTLEEGRIVLVPRQEPLPSIEEVRDKIADLGITEAEVAAAVAEVRGQGG